MKTRGMLCSFNNLHSAFCECCLRGVCALPPSALMGALPAGRCCWWWAPGGCWTSRGNSGRPGRRSRGGGRVGGQFCESFRPDRNHWNVWPFNFEKSAHISQRVLAPPCGLACSTTAPVSPVCGAILDQIRVVRTKPFRKPMQNGTRQYQTSQCSVVSCRSVCPLESATTPRAIFDHHLNIICIFIFNARSTAPMPSPPLPPRSRGSGSAGNLGPLPTAVATAPLFDLLDNGHPPPPSAPPPHSLPPSATGPCGPWVPGGGVCSRAVVFSLSKKVP